MVGLGNEERCSCCDGGTGAALLHPVLASSTEGRKDVRNKFKLAAFCCPVSERRDIAVSVSGGPKCAHEFEPYGDSLNSLAPNLAVSRLSK